MPGREIAEGSREMTHALSGDPVRTIPETWLVRNRWLAAGAAIVLLIAVVGLSLGLAAVWQQQKRGEERLQEVQRDAADARERQERAEKSYRLARTALDRSLEVMTDPRLHRGTPRDLQIRLVQVQQSFVEQLLELPGSDRGLRKERADAYFQLGRIVSAFDSPQQAIAAYEKALALFQELAAEESDSLIYLADLSNSLDNLGVLYSKVGRLNEAEDAFRRTIDIRVELAQRQSDNIHHITSQADTLNNLGRLLQRRGRWDDAEKAYRRGLESQSLALWSALAAKQSTVAELQRKLALCYVNLGIVSHHLQRWQEAKDNYTKALELQEKLAREHADIVGNTINLADARLRIGNLLRDRGDPAAALDWFAQALTSCEEALKREEGKIAARQLACEVYASRAATLDQLGRHAEASNDRDRALKSKKNRTRINTDATDWPGSDR